MDDYTDVINETQSIAAQIDALIETETVITQSQYPIILSMIQAIQLGRIASALETIAANIITGKEATQSD